MSAAHKRAIATWRIQALQIVTNPHSPQSQIELAWRFLRTWGAI